MEVQGHVTDSVADGGVGVGRSIIEESNSCVTGFLRCFRFMGSNGADGNEHGGADGNSVVE